MFYAIRRRSGVRFEFGLSFRELSFLVARIFKNLMLPVFLLKYDIQEYMTEWLLNH